MSFGNKDSGREYVRTNSNPSKMQAINNRNINTSQQYSNSNNGENYSYDMKSQRGGNSPKQSGEIHNNQQPSNSRDHYTYKNDNSRNRHFQGKYNERSNYYSQQSNSPNDVTIPDIDLLKEFIREQSEQFKIELAKYEGRKSCSPSPRSNFNQDHNQQRSQQRSSAGQNRSVSGMSTSNSLGTIACTNSNFSTVSSFATMSNIDKQSNSYSSKCNYNKNVQSTGKSNNFLNKNLSPNETFTKTPPVNKNRVSSPSNIVDKSQGNNKPQFTNIGVIRQDIKTDNNKNNKFTSYSFVPGINAVNSQQNTNNSITPLSYISDNRRSNQQIRPPVATSTNVVVSNGKNTSSSTYDSHKGSNRVNGDTDQVKPNRVEIRIVDPSRTISNSGNTTDSQDVEFCTPESPASPISLRSLQMDENRLGSGSTRCAKKA